MQKRVCVSIVDLVTISHFNLYADVLDMVDQKDPRFSAKEPATYAVTCRGRKVNEQPRLEIWAYPLVIGQNLPTLPIWLDTERVVPLDLEASYEEACRALRIR